MIPILNIEQFDKEINSKDVYSNELAVHLRKNSKFVHSAHRHDFFLCVVFSAGTGIHEIDFNHYAIQPGCVFFLKPGQTHLWKFESAPEGYIFFHTKEFFEYGFSNTEITQFPFYYSNENPPNLQLTLDELALIKSRFKEINFEYNTSATYKEQKLCSLINLAYIDLARLYTNFESYTIAGSTTYLKTLRVLETLIQEFYRSEKSVAFYADKLNITTKHLNRITNYSLDKTPLELINERIILEAKRLLVHSEDSLMEISDFLGFNDYAYFSRVFKLKTKSSPSDFRNHYKKRTI